MVRCSVRSCRSATKRTHTFPKHDIELMVKWLKIIDREDLLLTLTPQAINKYHFICDSHFSDEDKYSSSRHFKLKHGALPLLNLGGPINAGDKYNIQNLTGFNFTQGNQETLIVGNGSPPLLVYANKNGKNIKTNQIQVIPTITEMRASNESASIKLIEQNAKQSTSQMMLVKGSIQEVKSQNVVNRVAPQKNILELAMQETVINKKNTESKQHQIPNVSSTSVKQNQLRYILPKGIEKCGTNVNDLEKNIKTNILRKVTKEELIKHILLEKLPEEQTKTSNNQIDLNASQDGDKLKKSAQTLQRNTHLKTPIKKQLNKLDIQSDINMSQENAKPNDTNHATNALVLRKVSKEELMKNLVQEKSKCINLYDYKHILNKPDESQVFKAKPRQIVKPNILQRVMKEKVSKDICQEKLPQNTSKDTTKSNITDSNRSEVNIRTSDQISCTRVLKKITKEEVMKHMNRRKSQHNTSASTSKLDLNDLNTLSQTNEASNEIKQVTQTKLLNNMTKVDDSMHENSKQNVQIMNVENISNVAENERARKPKSVVKPNILRKVSKEEVMKHILQEKVPRNAEVKISENQTDTNKPGKNEQVTQSMEGNKSQNSSDLINKLPVNESQSVTETKILRKVTKEEVMKHFMEKKTQQTNTATPITIKKTVETNTHPIVEHAPSNEINVLLKNTKETHSVETNNVTQCKSVLTGNENNGQIATASKTKKDNLIGKSIQIPIPSADSKEGQTVTVRCVSISSVMTNLTKPNEQTIMESPTVKQPVITNLNSTLIDTSVCLDPEITSIILENRESLLPVPELVMIGQPIENNISLNPNTKNIQVKNRRKKQLSAKRQIAQNTTIVDQIVPNNLIISKPYSRRKNFAPSNSLNTTASTEKDSTNTTDPVEKQTVKQINVDLKNYTPINELDIQTLKSKLEDTDNNIAREPPEKVRIISDNNVPKVILRKSSTLSSKPDENFEIFIDPSVTQAPIIQALMKQKLIEAQERETNARLQSDEGQKQYPYLRKVPVRKLDPQAQRIQREYTTLKRRFAMSKTRMAKLKETVNELKTLSKDMKKLNKVPKLRNFIMNQIYNCDKPKGGRQYKLEDKLFAFSLYLRDPTYYDYLGNYFSLPKSTTMKNLLGKLYVAPGIINSVMTMLEILMQELNTQERLAIIAYQELLVKPHLDYDMENDRISGFSDDGNFRSQELANYIQVYMLIGLNGNWRSVVGYNCCTSTMRMNGVESFIKEIITRSNAINLRIVGIVNDYNSISAAAMSSLQRNTDIFNNVISLYEPNKLVKSIRNLLIDNCIKFKHKGCYKLASWSDIVLAFSIDSERQPPYNLLPKLTANHVNVKKMDKRKNSLCFQVFSLSMAKAINHYAELLSSNKAGEEFNDNSYGTRDFCQLMNDFCDSVNAEYNTESYVPSLIRIVTSKSCHLKFWTEAAQVVSTFEFISDNCSRRLAITQHLKSTIEGFTNLASLIFNKLEFRSFSTKHINHEPLDQFIKFVFDEIRDKHIELTCTNFLKSLVHYMTGHFFTTGKKSDGYKIVRCLEKFKEVLNERELIKKEITIPTYFETPLYTITVQDKQDSIKIISKFLDDNVRENAECNSCIDNYKQSGDYSDIVNLDLTDCENILNYNKELISVLFRIYKYCLVIFPDVLHEFDILAKTRLILMRDTSFSIFQKCEHMESLKLTMIQELPEIVLKNYIKDLNNMICTSSDNNNRQTEDENVDYL